MKLKPATYRLHALGITLLLVAATILATPVAGFSWTSAGPWGGVIHDLQNAPAGGNTLYAGTANGIYRYGGALPWEQFVQTKGYRILRIVPDTAGSVLYAIAQESAPGFDFEDPGQTGGLYRLDLTTDNFSSIMGTEAGDIAICGGGDLLATVNDGGVGYIYRFPAGGGGPVKIDFYNASAGFTEWPIAAILGSADSSTVFLIRNSSSRSDILISQNDAACGTTWTREDNKNRSTFIGGGTLYSLGYDDPTGEILAGSSNGRVFARNSGSWLAYGSGLPAYPVIGFGSDQSGTTYAILRKHAWNTLEFVDETPGGLFYYSGGTWTRDTAFDAITSRVMNIMAVSGDDWIAFDDAGVWKVPSGQSPPGTEADEGIAAVDLSGVVIDPRSLDRCLAYGKCGIYERRNGTWRRLVMGSITFPSGDPTGDKAQSALEKGFLSAAFSYDDPGVLWLGGDTTGLFRGEWTADGSWDYDWHYTSGGTLGRGSINDIFVDPFDSASLWWATSGGAFMTTDEGVSSRQVIYSIPVMDIDTDLLEPQYRTYLAGLKSGSTRDSALLSSDGGDEFDDSSLYMDGWIEALAFNPISVGYSQRGVTGPYGGSERMMAVVRDGSGAWGYNPDVSDPDLPGGGHFKSMEIPLGYDGDNHSDAFAAVEFEGTGNHAIYHSIADTTDGSPGETWVDVTDELTLYATSALKAHPKDGNLLWVTTHLGSAFTLEGSHVTDVIPPSFPLSVGLEVLQATASTVDLFWLAPGDDGDVPGWADAYELYYRTDHSFTGTADLVGASVVNPPSPHISHREELYSLDISGTSGSYIALALVAYDEQGNRSGLLTTEVLPLGGNTPPNAVDDSYSVDEDSESTISVLGNDSDADVDSLDVISVIQPANGLAILGTDDRVTYSPDADYYGSDSFQYTLVDGMGGSDTATVTLTVNPVPDDPVAGDDSAVTSEETSIAIDVLANDTDVDGDTVTVLSVGSASGGAATNNSGAYVTYTPNLNFFGNDIFVYTVTDGNGHADTATVTVTVLNSNDAPTAVDDSSGATEETPVTIDVLANDTDVDGDTLTVLSVGTASSGAVTNNSGADVTYIPNQDFFGNDTFTYTISDGNGGTANASVTVSVSNLNDNPSAVADSITTLKNFQVAVDVLANDTDADGDSLLVDSVTDGSNGTVANNSVDVTYTPDTDFTGADVFTYVVKDDYSATDSVSVTVNVLSDPGHPIANNDADETDEGTPVTIYVLANDQDFEGDPLTVLSVGSAASGAVTNNTTDVTYTPNGGFNGTDQFSYTIDDGNGNTDTATVTVTVNSVNDAPLAVDDSASAITSVSLVIDVLDNDTDVDGDPLVVDSVTDGSGGTVVNNGIEVTYTSSAGFAGTDQFTYVVTDGTDNDTGTVTVIVNNTPSGQNVSVAPYDASTGQLSPVRMTFAQINTPGIAACVSSSIGPASPAGYRALTPVAYYDLTTTADYSGTIWICIDYQGMQFADESKLRLYHDSGSGWEEVQVQQISTIDDEICGYSSSLPSFGVFEPIPAATPGGGGGGGGGCFIATAAYGSPMEPEVDLLRVYRDGYLSRRPWGRLLLTAYYALSPVPAGFISDKPLIRSAVRFALAPIIVSANGTGQSTAWPVAVGFGIIFIPLGIIGSGSFYLVRRIRKR